MPKFWKKVRKFMKKFRKNKKSDIQIIPVPPVKPRMHFKQLVDCAGYYYSGSSAVIGFLNEFDNTTVCGFADNVYSATSVNSGTTSEIVFFRRLAEIIESFYKNNKRLAQDIAIKRFIRNIYTCYDRKGIVGWEKLPHIYTNEFLDMSLRFFLDVVDIDEHTREMMRDKRYPAKWNSKDEKFKGCCFMHGDGIDQYVCYRFRNITPDEFDAAVKKYINEFYGLFDSKDFLVSDQMLQQPKNSEMEHLDRLNKYIDGAPVKQICVYRDPRDNFLSAYRQDMDQMPRDVDGFVEFYKNWFSLSQHMSVPNPNRLMIRFEDLVLKYDETTKKIMDFLGLDASHHVAPKSIFNPAISAGNIGAYKNFIDQDFMRQIQQRLPEYCYYPERENLSQEAMDLLKGETNA